jgi:hypothetical protein
MEIALDPSSAWALEHVHVRGLHAALTGLTGGHRPDRPAFSLLPWPCRSRWAVVVADDDAARALAGTRHQCALYDRPTAITLGPLVRLRAPASLAPGRYRVTIDSVTPVVISSHTSLHTIVESAQDERRRARVTPDAKNLRGSLVDTLARRLGLRDLRTEQLPLLLHSRETEPTRVRLGGKFGSIAGWHGRVVVETSATGAWLLLCAAQGYGLGGRTSFGFGRVRVQVELAQ